MKSVLVGLQVLGSVIPEICQISGTPSTSIGVLHGGKLIYTRNYGYRDVDAKFPPDVNTIFHIASLTNSFTAAV